MIIHKSTNAGYTLCTAIPSHPGLQSYLWCEVTCMACIDKGLSLGLSKQVKAGAQKRKDQLAANSGPKKD